MITLPVPEIDTDALTAFAPLAGQPFAHLLAAGRATAGAPGSDTDMIIAAPVSTLIVREGRVIVDGEDTGSAFDHGPFDVLRSMIASRPSGAAGEMPGFCSGAAGFIGYEMARYLEPALRDLPLPPTGLPDMAIGFYDAALHLPRRGTGGIIYGRTEEAAARLREMMRHPAGQAVSLPAAELLEDPAARPSYEAAVHACRERILDGSIFQANITRRLQAHFASVKPGQAGLPLFSRLHSDSASPYAALLQFEEGSVLSDSPEKYFDVSMVPEGFKVTAEPVKGTRRRSVDPVEDAAARRDLEGDSKDRAENVMIADLVRNDLSRVCRDHSIREEAICELQSFATVHHLVSRISGVLKPGLGAVDVLAASFPCGSITGAPKIRAMQVIAELERAGRGVYCGAIGWIDDRGGALFSVPIRTAVLDRADGGSRLSYGTGGGITVLSDPQAEYQETVTKAGPFRRLCGEAS